METIKTYLDNMFKGFPINNTILKIKSDLLSSMEDKYNELKRHGKSENEAIGIVISEFGNIDEIMNEFEIDHENKEVTVQTLKEEEVYDYLQIMKQFGVIIGIGVFLCIIGAALLILSYQFIEVGFINISENMEGIFGLFPLLILVAIAAGLFIYAGMNMEKYQFINKEIVELPMHIKETIEEKSNAFRPIYILSLIIGATLSIISPISILITSTISDSATIYGVVGLLLIVAIASYIFVYFGAIQYGYNALLNREKKL